jgi:hypothetical protein
LALRWGSAPEAELEDEFGAQKMTDRFREEKLHYEDDEDLTWEEKMMHK